MYRTIISTFEFFLPVFDPSSLSFTPYLASDFFFQNSMQLIFWSLIAKLLTDQKLVLAMLHSVCSNNFLLPLHIVRK